MWYATVPQEGFHANVENCPSEQTRITNFWVTATSASRSLVDMDGFLVLLWYATEHMVTLPATMENSSRGSDPDYERLGYSTQCI